MFSLWPWWRPQAGTCCSNKVVVFPYHKCCWSSFDNFLHSQFDCPLEGLNLTPVQFYFMFHTSLLALSFAWIETFFNQCFSLGLVQERLLRTNVFMSRTYKVLLRLWHPWMFSYPGLVLSYEQNRYRFLRGCEWSLLLSLFCAFQMQLNSEEGEQFKSLTKRKNLGIYVWPMCHVLEGNNSQALKTPEIGRGPPWNIYFVRH